MRTTAHRDLSYRVEFIAGDSESWLSAEGNITYEAVRVLVKVTLNEDRTASASTPVISRGYVLRKDGTWGRKINQHTHHYITGEQGEKLKAQAIRIAQDKEVEDGYLPPF